MTERIGRTELSNMFNATARSISAQRNFLSELDCICGDGDHGTTMVRATSQLAAAISQDGPQSLAAVFKDAGWRILGVDGGASSALLGTFVGGMGNAAIGETMDCSDLACTLEAGLTAVSRQTKALVGDKTMMDALVPAVHAMRTAADLGHSISAALSEAAVAAHTGAESTRGMVAKYGRARLLGERTCGHLDAGAMSIAIIFRSFSEAFSSEGEG